jgi:hypothetical protein
VVVVHRRLSAALRRQLGDAVDHDALIDDPLGRALEKEPQIKVLKYKAIAEHDEPHRRIGEPLFPAFEPMAGLIEQKGLMSNSLSEAEYPAR